MEPTAQQLRMSNPGAPLAGRPMGRQRSDGDGAASDSPLDARASSRARRATSTPREYRGDELPGDDALMREAQRGDAAAWDALARRYRGRVYVFALALLQRPEDAEDAAQETFLRAFRGLPAYEPRGQFRAWLLAIAANVCRAHYRHERRRAARVA